MAPRLRRITSRSSGWHRRRRGRGFSYVDAGGRRLTAAQAQHCRDLVIPPAWEDVWICPDPHGHLQAVGTDSEGRTQYLYHPDWRRRQDEAKFDRVLELAELLPWARRRALRDLKLEGMPRNKALAAAFRLLDRGLFRVGTESYRQSNGSFGLGTLRPDQVKISGDLMIFEFPAKSGIVTMIEVVDRPAAKIIRTLARRRTQRSELLAFREDGTWHNLGADTINAYLAEVIGADFTAKDFRTWHATVSAGVLLALVERARSDRQRRSQVLAVIDSVADLLGNTRTIARSSYIHPRVIDLFHEGRTLPASVVTGLTPDRPLPYPARVERAVVELLT
jgi:DNA topoisomerase IB